MPFRDSQAGFAGPSMSGATVPSLRTSTRQALPRDHAMNMCRSDGRYSTGSVKMGFVVFVSLFIFFTRPCSRTQPSSVMVYAAVLNPDAKLAQLFSNVTGFHTSTPPRGGRYATQVPAVLCTSSTPVSCRYTNWLPGALVGRSAGPRTGRMPDSAAVNWGRSVRGAVH